MLRLDLCPTNFAERFENLVERFETLEINTDFEARRDIPARIKKVEGATEILHKRFVILYDALRGTMKHSLALLGEMKESK